MLNYTQDQLWKLYENLPTDLKDAIFSPDTADDINNTCEKYKIADKKMSEIAKYVGYVLLGVLPPTEFQKALEAEIGIEKETAKAIDHDINRFVFWPVKENLASLHGTELAPSEKMPEAAPVLAKESPQKGRQKRKDTYRETIE